MYQNLGGTLNSVFSLGRDTNSASFRVKDGVLEWSDYTTDGYLPMSNIDDTTTDLITTWSSTKVESSYGYI